MQGKTVKKLTKSNEVYEYALRLLDRREYCEAEMIQKMKRRGAPEEIILQIIAKLKEYDLLNEERYAARVYEAWINKKVYGRMHLKAELIKKQVPDIYADAIMENFSDEEEEERAVAAVEKALHRRDGKYDPSTQKGKNALARYLAARGFSSGLVRSIVFRYQ